jgi:hypothetical protein
MCDDESLQYASKRLKQDITHATTQRRNESHLKTFGFMFLNVASLRRRLEAPTFGA